MNAKTLALTVILGLAVPTVSLSFTSAATAKAPVKLQGFFMDGDWSVDVTLDRGVHKYRGTNLKTNNSIELQRSKISGSDRRQIYTWKKGSTQYHVIWQPQDPDFVRLRVSDNGRILVDRLLARESGCSA
jgi:hypothetical protein